MKAALVHEASPLVPAAAPAAAKTMSRAALIRRVGPALLGNMLEFYEFGIYALVSEAISDNFFATSAEHEYGVWFGFAISFIARPGRIAALWPAVIARPVGVPLWSKQNWSPALARARAAAASVRRSISVSALDGVQRAPLLYIPLFLL